MLPGSITAADCDGRAGLRCATRDRLPLAGPVPNRDELVRRFALLRKNANAAIPHDGAVQDGLYVSAGYGSRGLAYVPLCTEALVAEMLGEPPPFGRRLQRALSPSRFVIRDLARGKA